MKELNVGAKVGGADYQRTATDGEVGTRRSSGTCPGSPRMAASSTCSIGWDEYESASENAKRDREWRQRIATYLRGVCDWDLLATSINDSPVIISMFFSLQT